MIKNTYEKLKLLLSCLLLCSICSTTSWGQARIQVKVVSVQVLNNVDCDGFLSGDSDYVFEYIATDNTLGRSNNNPTLFGFLGDFNHAFNNGNNGPWILNSPHLDIDPSNGIFFDHDYVCPNDVPTSITIDWQGYENDAPTNYDLTGGLFSEVRTGAQSGNIAVPGAPGTVSQIFNASGTSGCGTQNYRITIEVTRTALILNVLEDDICNAPALPLNTNRRFAWCPNCTLEPNEPHRGDVTANKSRWFYFIAPPSGSVEVTTDIGGTDFGTYFEIYHAADGAGCVQGTNVVSGAVIKNKFDYLSHIEFSDGTDLLGVDPEAEITLDACDPVALISYQKLHAGQVYYVQVTTDDANERGYIEIAVNDQGGSTADAEDLPCISPATGFGTTAISSGAGSPATINLNFGCAYDGGNDFGETGGAHTNNDPNNYHAYDYDHPAVSNNTMNESVWFNFVAPNSGRIVFETDYDNAIYGENAAFFALDPRFAPGVPADYSCADLTVTAAVDGGLNGILGGGVESAIIERRCLEPGYTYYGMVDPSDNITPFSPQNIDVWLHDPSVADPANNPPPNDILCLTMADTLFEIPVKPVGQTIPFSAVAGDNTNACIETLAGEPFCGSSPATRADQTVWHFFTVPPSGVVEMKIRAYIGLDSLNFAVYELFQDSLCYGGLQPATFTLDGTRATVPITAIASGTTDFAGSIVGLCCLVPGTKLAIQLDGGHPGDEGQYIIEYINEVEVYAGDAQFAVNGDTFNFMSVDTGYVCFGDTMIPSAMVNGLGVSTIRIANCMDIGYVVHDSLNIPDSIINGNFVFLDSVYLQPHYWVNDGTQGFTNNTLHYVSPMADEQSTWGQLTCPSASAENSAAFVFLREIVVVTSYNTSNCIIDFSATGGMPAYNGSLFDYVITNSLGDTMMVGQSANGALNQFQIPVADTYTITFTDNKGCNVTVTVNATPCNDPCINNPVIITPDPIDSTVYTCYPGGDSAMVTIYFNGGQPTTTVGAAYTATVSGSTAPNASGVYSVVGTGAPGATAFSFTVMDGDTWNVISIDANGCADTVSAFFDYNLLNCPDYCTINPVVSSYTYSCNLNGTAMVMVTIGGGSPSINGSNYTVNIAGSTVFGQNYQNAQIPGVVGGTVNFSFVVNSGDSWVFDVMDNNMCTDTLQDLYLFDTAHCPICTMMPVQLFPDPVDSTVYTCTANGDAEVTLFLTGGAPSINTSLYNVTTSGSTVAGQNGTNNEDVGLLQFNVADGDIWTVVAIDSNGCADTATSTFVYNALNLDVAFGAYDCLLDKSADVSITLSGGRPATDGSNYLVTIIGSTTSGVSAYQIPVAGTIGGVTNYTFNVQDGDDWVVVVTDGSYCGIDSISGTFLWNATNCGNICTDPNYVGVAINGGSGVFNYVCDSAGMGILSLQLTGGLPEITNGNDDYIANVTINGVSNLYLVDASATGATFTMTLANGDSWSILVYDALQCDTPSLAAVFTGVRAVATAITPPGMLLGQSATLDGAASTGNITTYSWTPIVNVTNPNTAVTTTTPMTTTTYWLAVSDSLGCVDSASVLVEIGRCVPNHAGFTPNGDGVNDFWEIPCLDLFTNRVQVFNRWGQMVFEAENYDSTWDGTNLGAAVPDATYYYVISVDDPQFSNPTIYKGTVTIIR